MDEIENKVSKYLLELGFKPNIKGYRLLRELLITALNDETVMPLKYEGYVRLGEKFGISPETVEKDIQNAIAAAWLRGDVDEHYEAFGETLDEDKGKPTNKQFLLTAIDKLRFCY